MIDQSLWESVLGGYENWTMLIFHILLCHVKKKTKQKKPQHIYLKILVLQWL